MIKRMMIALTIIAGLTGCGNDDKEVAEKAKKVAIEYVKEKKEKTFIVEDVEFTSAIGGGTVFVNGYCKEEPDKKMDVAVHYEGDDYRVGSIGYDK